MTRVVLLQPPHRDTFGYSMPPLGILHAGAAARARGHEVAFLDLALLVRRGELPAATPAQGDTLIARCAQRVLALQPEVLGIGAMISSMPAALALAAELRRRAPQVPILIGGQGPEAVEEPLIARHAALDAVCVGEGDYTLADALDAWDAADGSTRDGRALWGEVAGLVVRDARGAPHRTPPRALLTPLDAVPSPAWDLAESPLAYAQAAGETQALFPIDLGRGCSFACSFCTTPIFWGRTARHLSPGRAVDELDRLASLGDVGCAYVTHDLYTFDRASVLAMCAEKTRRGNTLPWECRTRIDLVDEELLAAMGAAGCRRILYGVESESPAMLAAMHKGGRAASTDVRAVLAAAARAGVASIVGTMAGVPGESAADVEANLRLMAQAATIDGVSLSLHWFNVTPGNGRAPEVAEHAARGDGTPLQLVPGLSADLVRGHDLPVGHVAPEQAALIAEDAEVFAAFRVSAPAWTTPAALHRLTRNSHLLLEALPRTIRALALDARTSLLDVLTRFLAELDTTAAPADWAEPDVLHRARGVALLAAHARRVGGPLLGALAEYEQALLATESERRLPLAHDPRPLLAAVSTNTWPPSPAPPPVTLLLRRRGDRVSAAVLLDTATT